MSSLIPNNRAGIYIVGLLSQWCVDIKILTTMWYYVSNDNVSALFLFVIKFLTENERNQN